MYSPPQTAKPSQALARRAFWAGFFAKKAGQGLGDCPYRDDKDETTQALAAFWTHGWGNSAAPA